MLKYWLWLTERPGLTNQVRLALLRHFGTPEAVYYADPEELLLTEGMTAAQVRRSWAMVWLPAVLWWSAVWPGALTARLCGARFVPENRQWA